MSQEGMRGGLESILLFPLLLAAATASAAQPSQTGTRTEATIAVDLGVGRSDNLNRTVVDEVSENIATAGLQLDVNRVGRRVDADIAARLHYFNYLDNVYRDELSGRLDGVVTIGVVPDRFNWVVEDNYGQALVDVSAAPSVLNRESINFFSTGPELLFGLGEGGFARLFGRYAATTYQVTPLDGNRRQVGLSIGRRSARNSSLSLNLVGERLEYDRLPSTPGYDREQLFVHYDTQGARTRLAVDVGYTKIVDVDYANGGKLLQLELSRAVSSSLQLSLGFGVRTTDSSDRFRMADGGAITTAQVSAVAATGEIFENRFVRAGFDLTGGRTNVSFSVSVNDDVYARSVLLNRTRSIGEVSVRRQVTRAFSARVEGSYSSDAFEVANSDFSEWMAGLGFRVALGRRMFASLDLNHYVRTADIALRDSAENRAFVKFGIESR